MGIPKEKNEIPCFCYFSLPLLIARKKSIPGSDKPIKKNSEQEMKESKKSSPPAQSDKKKLKIVILSILLNIFAYE